MSDIVEDLRGQGDKLHVEWADTAQMWCAYYDAEGLVGLGKTREDAVAELLDQTDEAWRKALDERDAAKADKDRAEKAALHAQEYCLKAQDGQQDALTCRAEAVTEIGRLTRELAEAMDTRLSGDLARALRVDLRKVTDERDRAIADLAASREASSALAQQVESIAAERDEALKRLSQAEIQRDAAHEREKQFVTRLHIAEEKAARMSDEAERWSNQFFEKCKTSAKDAERYALVRRFMHPDSVEPGKATMWQLELPDDLDVGQHGWMPHSFDDAVDAALAAAPEAP